MLRVGEGEERMRGRSTEGEADARAWDACARIIILMRFTENSTKCGGRGGRIWGRPHDAEKTALEGNKGGFFFLFT